jgi:ankyrin repeat protein
MSTRCLLSLITLTAVSTFGCGPSTERRAELTEQLQYSVLFGETAKAKALIAAGADFNALRDGVSLPHLAVMSGNIEMLDLLLTANANPDVSTNRGVTPLIAAVLSGAEDCASKLISIGVNLNAKNSKGTTALIVATTNKLNNTAIKLIRAGAEISCQTHGNKTTALMMAAHNDMVDVAKLLVSKGADPHIKDVHGKSSLDYAQTPRMLKLLEGISKREFEPPAVDEAMSPTSDVQ